MANYNTGDIDRLELFGARTFKSVQSAGQDRYGRELYEAQVEREFNAKQLEFFDLIFEGNKKCSVMLGGVRSGKTTGMVYGLWKYLYTKRLKKNLAWIISPTYKMSLVTERIFRETAAETIIVERKSERAFLLYPPSGNERGVIRVEMKSADDPESLRGAGVDIVGLDEAFMVSYDAYKILLARIADTGGKMLIATTPRTGNWLYEQVYLKHGEETGIIECTSYDNKFVPREYIEELEKHYSPEYAQQEIYAKFVTFEGLVYKDFADEKHVIAPIIAPENISIVCGIDFGYSDAFVCVWLGKFEDKWIMLDEYYAKGKTYDEHVSAILDNSLSKQVECYYADPSNPQGKIELMSRGVKRIHPGRNEIDMGINHIAALIVNGHLTITTKCEETLKEIKRYRYKDTDDKNRGEKPVDAHNHCMDAMRYALYTWSKSHKDKWGKPKEINPYSEIGMQNYINKYNLFQEEMAEFQSQMGMDNADRNEAWIGVDD